MKPTSADLRHLFLSLSGISVITWGCFRLVPSYPLIPAFLLLLVVLLTAITARRSFAFLAAFLATLALDVFFLPPIGLLTVTDPQDWSTLLVFCIICLVVGNLSSRLRSQRDDLLVHQEEAERIHALSQSLLMTGPEDDAGRSVVNRCLQLFGLDQFALYESRSQRFHLSHTAGPFPEDAMRSASGKSTVSLDGASWNIVPVTLGNIQLGSVAYTRQGALSPSTVDSLVGTIALALAQTQAQQETTRAHAVRRSEELKSVMIDALAHDLKTPLTSIEAAADMLSAGRSLSQAQSQELVTVIREETHRLKRLVDEATHLARIDANRLKLDLRPESILHLVRFAIASLGDRTADGRIEVGISPDLPPVLVDSELVSQAVKQLLDNALKYGPSRSKVQVCATETGGIATISVRDNGPGLTELEQSKVFDKFYRGRYDRSAIQGTGMGLAIAREIIEAHGGSLGVRSYVGQGTEFFISLKTVELPQVVDA